MTNTFLPLAIMAWTCLAVAQPGAGYWQQRVSYQMDIDFDVNKHQFDGYQKLVWQNNSPDTIHRLFYHLYLNAFQPGSMMDTRAQHVPDPDDRVAERIAKLKPDERGYTRIKGFKHNGEAPTAVQEHGTILEVKLAKPILPGEQALLEMNFESQVPLQIRRNGRNNAEGIAYSMAQWYPKICAYDRHGWHADDYIGREFYGTFGDFEVRIQIDPRYVVAATGVLQNPAQVGHGYAQRTEAHTGKKLLWHFKADNVNDFVWAADPDYRHVTFTRANGNILRFFYQPGKQTEAWEKLPAIMDRAFDYIEAHYGTYPYPEYAFIQGGDGGMEYPMATLITGHRPLNSLVGVSVHELLHCWYPMILGTNEARYAWMDEGFVTYATSDVMNYLAAEGLLPGRTKSNLPQASDYVGYTSFALTSWEEPLSTPSDHFQTNVAYGVGSYSKGAVFLAQLAYVIGKEALDAGLLRYYHDWKFKHPDDKDFIRIMEKVSGLELDWYLDYFVYSTHTIDYMVNKVEQAGARETVVLLERKGKMPMPVDVEVTLQNGDKLRYHIPLCMMRGGKKSDSAWGAFQTLDAWPWVQPVYALRLPVGMAEMAKVVIDPTKRMADVARANNEWPAAAPSPAPSSSKQTVILKPEKKKKARS